MSDTDSNDTRTQYARAAVRRGSSVEGIAGLYCVPVDDVEAMLREEE